MPGVDTGMTQHRFFSYWPQAYFPQLSARIHSEFHIWGGAGNGELPFSEEDLPSLMSTCRGTGMTTRDPAVHNDCPVCGSLCLTLRRNHFYLLIPFSSSPISRFLKATIPWSYLPRISLSRAFQVFPSFG